ncbi:MAG TPA: hypothetical protein VI409_10550 [Gaiellaceae bacterium]|nr:hypothetical protein [Gaiellaceae bacterium]
MSYRLWWRWNDGVGGHVWLSADDARRLADEMALQGCGGFADRITSVEDEATITPQEVAAALESVSAEPIALADVALWEDWIHFLEGAEAKGGLLVRR